MATSMLDEKLSILIRETLDDTGDRTYSNASPDIIVRKNKFEEDDPAKIFTKTYSQDISLESDDSGEMYLYVRFKNMSDQPLTNFYIHLYRNHLGLSNRPSDWSDFEMYTEAGTSAHIESLGAGKIGATPAFVYKKGTGAHPNCFVAVATREKEPDYASISDAAKYIQWVNKSNVAARNVRVIPGQSGIYTATVYLDNPSMEREKQMLLKVDIEEKTPSGINYGIRQSALGIDERRTYIEGDSATGSIACAFPMGPGTQYSFDIWFEANEKDCPLIKSTCRFYSIYEGNANPVLNQYLVDLHTGVAIPDGAENLSETSACGYLLGCCYFKGSDVL